jgi:hypothetical protein
VASDYVSFSDASIATGSKMHSVSGLALFYRGCLYAWKSSRQTIRAYNTCEAEYVAAADGFAWLEIRRPPLEFLEGKTVEIPHFVDSSSAIQVANCEEPKDKSRHFRLRWWRVRDNARFLQFCGDRPGTR